MERLVLIAAGGTGGHLFPAEALAHALTARGWRVQLATDRRVEGYGSGFPAEKVHLVRSATLTRSPTQLLRALPTLGLGFLDARRIIAREKPAVAIGFGGYPTVPPILAAIGRVPTIIHEQNAVFGRANRFLAPHVTRVAVSVPEVRGAERLKDRIVLTGNPVRPAVRAAASVLYPMRAAGDPFHLTVSGGSQGAQFLSDLVPAAVAMLPADIQSRLRIVEQCRPEDIDRVAQAYDLLGVAADLQPFFTDMPARIAGAHLVISRSGASTTTELAVIGRPAIMIPLPHALDQDQKANANVLAAAGAGWMIEQKEMTPERLASELELLIESPDRLAAAATAAKSLGRPEAVDNLADLVEKVAA